MCFNKIILQFFLLLLLSLGLTGKLYSQKIHLFCYLKNVSSDSKRFYEPIFDEDNESPVVIDGKFDHLLQEYIIDPLDYEGFYKHCQSEASGRLLVDLKGMSISNSYTTFIFSVGPKGLAIKSKKSRKLSRFISSFIGAHHSLKKIYKNPIKGTLEALKDSFDSDSLDASHSIQKLTAIYNDLPAFQERFVDENPELAPIRKQFEQDTKRQLKPSLFVSEQVARDFPRFDVRIVSDGACLYRSANLEEGSKNHVEQPFDILEQFYSERLAIPLDTLRKHIGLALHTRTQGFDNQSVDLFEYFDSFGKNMIFRIGNEAQTIHFMELEDDSLNLITQTELILSVPELEGENSLEIGRFVVIRFMNFDMLSGRCGEQYVLIEKIFE